MAWLRWLVPDRLVQPRAFSDWALSVTHDRDREVVIVAGVLGLACAVASALFADHLAESLLGAVVFGPLAGWSVVYFLTSIWHAMLQATRNTVSKDHSMAAVVYGLAPLAWLAILGASLSALSGWGMSVRMPVAVIWGTVVLGLGWVMWLMVTTMSRMQRISVWLATVTLVATGLIMTLPFFMAFYSVALPMR